MNIEFIEQYVKAENEKELKNIKERWGVDVRNLESLREQILPRMLDRSVHFVTEEGLLEALEKESDGEEKIHRIHVEDEQKVSFLTGLQQEADIQTGRKLP